MPVYERILVLSMPIQMGRAPLAAGLFQNGNLFLDRELVKHCGQDLLGLPHEYRGRHLAAYVSDPQAR